MNEMHQATYISLRVENIRQETSTTKSFELKQLTGKPIQYKAGQFLTLVFKKGSQDERRAYSISSTPLLNEPLTITVRRIANGEYSRYLFDQVAVGDTLYTIGPAGYFTLPDDRDTYQQFFFLAAGSGIAPILPLIKTALYDRWPAHCTLIYSNQSIESTIFFDELVGLAEKHSDQLKIDFLHSNSKHLLKARLSKALLQQYVTSQVKDKAKTRFYICGPFNYMQMATITLLTEGIPAENIRKENFSTEKPVIKEQPPDVNPHEVKIQYENQEHIITVQYPLTILEAAKQRGLILPYNCEAGRCGTCAAKCDQGKVWHSYNEVLVDRELDNGRILTCTAYPYGEEQVIISYPDPG